MNRCLAVCVVGIVMFSGCALIPRETRYLQSAQGQVSQDPEGDESKLLVDSGSWCDEYTLRFDTAGVLRDWSHQSYLHGGELMPVS